MRPRTPQRERSGRTPNRERPSHQNAGQSNLPVEVVLQAYAAHFPALPRDQTVLPRGRKDRRGACPWDDFGGCDSRTSSRSCSRGHFREEDVEEERPVGRSRACSFDMAADGREQKDSRPTTPRGGLKKPRQSIGDGDVEKAKQAEITQQEIQQKMKELMALMGPGSDTQTHLATQLTKLLDSAATEFTNENNASSAEDTTKELTTRRLSNPTNPSTPRSMEAPPGGSSWEYPLTKEEKKARIVMISSAEIECLTEENHSLNEEMARMNIGSSR